MQLKFDAHQGYQLAAIESVVGLFEGLSVTRTQRALCDEIVPNLAPGEALQEDWLLKNLNAVREAQAVREDVESDAVLAAPLFALAKERGPELEGVSSGAWEFPGFTIEMETGTGKTYVYLRTVYELRRRYGFSKFIIIVPSVAIYEGVIKTEATTRAHFRALYANETAALIPYDGSRLSGLRHFAASTSAQILLMTIDAFNSKSNNLYKPSEKLPGERLPYQLIQETRPVLILDEPQSIDTTERARSAIRTLHPLFSLRYSATHRTHPNLIYRLTPLAAVRRNLVKKIQVIGLAAPGNLNEKPLALEAVTRRPITARVKTCVQEQGLAVEKTVTLKQGSNLFASTHRDEHRNGYTVREISAAVGNCFVRFENGVRLTLDETPAPSLQEIFRVQVEQTVRQHMETQEALLRYGVKVLSLFFIDRVANYTAPSGIVKKSFDAAFKELQKSFRHFAGYAPAEVRRAYFARAKPAKGATEGLPFDTNGSNAAEREAERAAFALIMRDKERLLSFAEPVAFIFAHSALREGWDNPNIFQLCTLRQTLSKIERRQQIGRGLRLAVNQQGERVTLNEVNLLTVIADESYEAYAAGLQSEYLADGDTPPPQPARLQPSQTQHTDTIMDDKELQSMRRKLNQHARRALKIDSATLIQECVNKLSAAELQEPAIVITRGRFNITEDASRRFANGAEVARANSSLNFKSEQGEQSPARELLSANRSYPVFNFIDRAALETKLTRRTLNLIFERLPGRTQAKLFQDPEGFSAVFITKIKEAVTEHLAACADSKPDDEMASTDVAEDLSAPQPALS